MGPHPRRTCQRSNEALAVHVLTFAFASALARNSQGLPPTYIPKIAHLPVLFKPATTLSAPLPSSSYHYPPPTRTFSRRPRLRF